MTDQTPIRDFLHPRVAALVRDAVAQGMAQDVVVAVAIDLITSGEFDTAAPDPTADSLSRPDWDRSHSDAVMITAGVTANAPRIGVHAEDDFIAPLTIHD